MKTEHQHPMTETGKNNLPRQSFTCLSRLQHKVSTNGEMQSRKWWIKLYKCETTVQLVRHPTVRAFHSMSDFLALKSIVHINRQNVTKIEVFRSQFKMRSMTKMSVEFDFSAERKHLHLPYCS